MKPWRRHQCTVLLAGLIAGHAAPALAQTPPPQTLADQAANVFWWGEFQALERLNAPLRQPGQRDAGGVAKLRAFRQGLNRVFDVKGATEPYHAQLDALTLEWARQQPTSALAHVLHAKALAAHAWWYRGGGYANTVPPKAWAEFEKYLRQAAEYLAANASTAFSDSSAHLALIAIGRGIGWSADRVWSVAQDGLLRNPDDDELYFAALQSHLPKWGGTPVSLDRFIQDVVARTRKERGLELYARLYAEAARAQFEARIFSESAAQWPLMKQGYEDWVQRYPEPAKLNRFAYFACLAEDKATLLDLLEKIGSKPALDDWGRTPLPTLQTCKRWAAGQ